MTTVTTVFFETNNAIFRFTVDDVMDHLNRNEADYDEKEVTVLKHLVSSATEDSITISKDHRLFPYVTLNLLRDNKGTVYCKTCDKAYKAAELKLVRVGHGETPFSPNVIRKGWLRKVFGRKPRLPLFGGRGYGVQQQRGLLLLTGDVGTGKTTLVNALLEQLDESILVGNITNPKLGLIGFRVKLK